MGERCLDHQVFSHQPVICLYCAALPPPTPSKGLQGRLPGPTATNRQPATLGFAWVGGFLPFSFSLVLLSSICTVRLSDHRLRRKPWPLEDNGPHIVLPQPVSASPGCRGKARHSEGPAGSAGTSPAPPEWGTHLPGTLPGEQRGGAGGEPQLWRVPWGGGSPPHPGWGRGARLAPSRLTNCSV